MQESLEEAIIATSSDDVIVIANKEHLLDLAEEVFHYNLKNPLVKIEQQSNELMKNNIAIVIARSRLEPDLKIGFLQGAVKWNGSIGVSRSDIIQPSSHDAADTETDPEGSAEAQ